MGRRSLWLCRLLTALLVIGLFACDDTQDESVDPASPTVSTSPPSTTARAEFSTPAGTVRVLDVRVDEGVSFTTRWEDGAGSVERRIRLSTQSVRAGWRGFEASIQADGREAFGLVYEWDEASALPREHVFERAGGRELSLERRVDGLDVHEDYLIDGQVRAYRYKSGRPPLVAPADLYAVDNPLYANEDGERLVHLLTDELFVDWLGELAGVTDGGGSSGMSGCPRWLSWGSGVCSGLKCAFGGGLLNPVCIACGGVSIACAVADAACMLTDPDCAN